MIDRQDRLDREQLLLTVLDSYLTATQRRRLWLYCVEGWTMRRIADAENVKHPSIVESLAAARGKIKNFWKLLKIHPTPPPKNDKISSAFSYNFELAFTFCRAVGNSRGDDGIAAAGGQVDKLCSRSILIVSDEQRGQYGKGPNIQPGAWCQSSPSPAVPRCHSFQNLRCLPMFQAGSSLGWSRTDIHFPAQTGQPS